MISNRSASDPCISDDLLRPTTTFKWRGDVKSTSGRYETFARRSGPKESVPGATKNYLETPQIPESSGA